MTAKKSALDHLNSGRKPHIVYMIPPGAPGYRDAADGGMVISSPAEINAMIRTVRRGEVVTLDDIRAALARRHGVSTACPVSTAIFVNICARAAEEQRSAGLPIDGLVPWWRVLKKGGLLNPKLPGGVAVQAELLDADGVRVSPLRKTLAVYDYEDRRPSDRIEERS